MKHTLLNSLMILTVASSLSAKDPYVFQAESNEYESESFQFHHEISFADMIDNIGVDRSLPFSLSLDVDGPLVLVRVAQQGRDYYSPITPQEKGDLSELVRTLANDSLLSLPGKEKNLKRIGDRLVHLHPLKFLTIIFTDNELKVCMKNMEGKAWVWDKFQGETVDSLAKENAAGNLAQDQINDFAQKIGLNSGDITSYVKGQRWKELISFLISKVKVDKPQGKKYNM